MPLPGASVAGVIDWASEEVPVGDQENWAFCDPEAQETF